LVDFCTDSDADVGGFVVGVESIDAASVSVAVEALIQEDDDSDGVDADDGNSDEDNDDDDDDDGDDIGDDDSDDNDDDDGCLGSTRISRSTCAWGWLGGAVYTPATSVINTTKLG